ncbi:MAG TPA: glycosyltransferase family 2 protein [Clostridia bacterium]|nr:glycosyltransferase family 2 protein [Clostridia bacterium]
MNPENITSAIPARPRVSIVVPARNEEANLERCLRSLVVQRGVRFEVVVVDDGSTDRTREIAETFVRVKQCPVIGANEDLVAFWLVPAPPLPEGWAGKNNACWAGASESRGDWLLFTDADTEHQPGSLAEAFREAHERKLDLLSYSPEQILAGAAQHAVMPLIFGELATRYRPKKIADPASPEAAANGQYLLIRRGLYDRLGGHAAVAGSLLEDVAIARAAKQSGGRIALRLGRGLVTTRMYRDWKQTRDGWTKNLALLFPRARKLAARRLLEFVALPALPIAALAGHLAGWRYAAILAIPAAWLWWRFYARVVKAHFPAAATAVSFLGLPAYAWLLVRSARAHAGGQVRWKGREYEQIATSGGTTESKVAGA